MALKATSRWSLNEQTLAAGPSPVRLTVSPEGMDVPADLRTQLLGGKGVSNPFCAQGGACRVYPQSGGTTFVVVMDGCANLPPARQVDPKARCSTNPAVFERRDGKWQNVYDGSASAFALETPKDSEAAASLKRERDALNRGDVKVEPVTVRQVVIGGKPSGQVFK